MEHRSDEKCNAGIYPGDFISVIQVGPRERHQILRHLFHQIYRVFRTNEEAYINRKDPILLKNMEQVDGAWSTQKTVLRWD